MSLSLFFRYKSGFILSVGSTTQIGIVYDA